MVRCSLLPAPGTGKTRTLVHRVAYPDRSAASIRARFCCSPSRAAPPRKCLRRASLLIDNRCSQVAGGTLPLLCQPSPARVRPPDRSVALVHDHGPRRQRRRDPVAAHRNGLDAKGQALSAQQTDGAAIFSMALNKQTPRHRAGRARNIPTSSIRWTISSRFARPLYRL